MGATATTAASGGNREELLGQRPAGCKRQRSRRWVPQPGRWHRAAMTERASRLSQSRCAAISRLFVRAMLSLCQCFSGSILALSVCFAATSPIGRGTGVPVRPTRDEQSLLYPETVVPCGLDSQQLDKALLFRSRCPRKRGPLFCALSGLMRPAKSGPARQWLPLWGSWHRAAMTERASRLSQSRCAAISRLFVRAMLSLCQCFSGSILALSVCFAATSPIGRGTGVPVRLTRDEQSLRCPKTVVPCGLAPQQLDKVLLSRSRCPRKRGPLFCALSGLGRPVQSGPARQWLPLWGSWREAPERACRCRGNWRANARLRD